SSIQLPRGFSSVACLRAKSIPASIARTLIRVTFLSLLSKTVQSAARPDVNPAVGDRGSGVNFIIQLVHFQHFPFAGSLEHGHLTSLANEKDLVIGRHG